MERFLAKKTKHLNIYTLKLIILLISQRIKTKLCKKKYFMNIYFLRQSFENIKQMLLKKINDN